MPYSLRPDKRIILTDISESTVPQLRQCFVCTLRLMTFNKQRTRVRSQQTADNIEEDRFPAA